MIELLKAANDEIVKLRAALSSAEQISETRKVVIERLRKQVEELEKEALRHKEVAEKALNQLIKKRKL